MYYLVQLMTVIILSLAANTAFADLPHLMAMMAEDRYLPRRLVYRGSRLNYTNGIAFLFFASGILTLVFDADQHKLLPLFASGIFISFFLNQLGMLRYWNRTRGRHWILHSAVNTLALIATSITLVVLVVTRFVSGAWIALLSIALLTELMLAIRRHYNRVRTDLAISSIEDARNMLSTTRSSLINDQGKKQKGRMDDWVNAYNLTFNRAEEGNIRTDAHVSQLVLTWAAPFILRSTWRTCVN